MTCKQNPVFWLMWLLPASAVCASFATLAIALSGADRALPPAYHWEGERLDADFARARHAAALGVVARLSIDAASQQCVLRLQGGSPQSPTLRLLLTHSSDADFDRAVLLKLGAPGEYRASCPPLPAGRWRLALDDDVAGWSVRTRVDGSRDIEIRARHPGA